MVYFLQLTFDDDAEAAAYMASMEDDTDNEYEDSWDNYY